MNTSEHQQSTKRCRDDAGRTQPSVYTYTGACARNIQPEDVDD